MGTETVTKRLKFSSELVSKILSGEKTSTWRIDDDKNLQPGDVVSCIDAGTDAAFATVRLTDVFEKPFRDLLAEDRTGHETYTSDAERYAWFSEHYRKPVGPDTVVKVAGFSVV